MDSERNGRVEIETDKQKGIKKEVKQVGVTGALSGTDDVLMSNNINPFTVMPLSPNQVRGNAFTTTISVNVIQPATTGRTIQVAGNMNTGGLAPALLPNSTFQYQGQSIYPYEIYDPTSAVTAKTSVEGVNTPTFAVAFPNGNLGDTAFTPPNVTFNTNQQPGYTMDVYGSVGIGTAANTDYALTIAGDVNISGAVDISAVKVSKLGIGTTVASGYIFDVSGASLFEQNIDCLTNINSSNITASALLNGNRLESVLDANIGTSLLVNSTSQLQGNVGIGKAASGSYALDVLGTVNVSNTVLTSNIRASGTADISGNTFFGANVGIGSTIPPALASFPNSLYVKGTIESGTDMFIKNKLIVGETSAFSLPAPTLYVNGRSGLLGNVAIGSAIQQSQLRVDGSGTTSIFTGNLTVQGTFNPAGGSTGGGATNTSLVVSGPSTLNGTLDVYGVTTLHNTSEMQGAVTMTSTLDVQGTSILEGNVNLFNNLDVSGASLLYGNVTLSNNLDVSGTSILRGNVTLSNNLDVVGTSLLKGAASLHNNLDVSGTSLLRGNTSLYSNLDVSGTSLLHGNVTLSNNLDVSGTSLLRGNTSLYNNLDVSGTSLLQGNVTLYNNLDVSGSIHVRNALDVSGSVAIRNNLDVSGASLLQGNVTLYNNLDVSGNIHARNNLDVSGSVAIRNNLDVSGTARIVGNLNYHIDVERIIYRTVPYNNGLGATAPGYWALSGDLIHLNMPLQPTMYIIDGSAALIDMSVNLVTPLSYSQIPGMTFTFVARNTTGAGHRLIYPYDTGVHSTTLIPTPISTTVVCIGENNYSSSV